jgi:UTP--glucose-1-phosphate uridylyltransferase
MPQKINKVVFPVAGLGTRFLPVTKSVPKELLPVVDTPLIQYAIEESRQAGIESFVFVNAPSKSAIEDYFSHTFASKEQLKSQGKTKELDLLMSLLPDEDKIHFIEQNEALGLGHAVWCAKPMIGDEPFAVILPDDLVDAPKGCMQQLVEAYEETGGNVVAVEEVPRDQTNRYGVLDVGAIKGPLVEVKGLVEKPDPAEAPSTLSIIGRYILMPEVFTHLEAHEKGAGGEIQLTDAMAKMIGHTPFHGYQFEGVRYDCGSKLGFIHANLALALGREEFADRLKPILLDLVDEIS